MTEPDLSTQAKKDKYYKELLESDIRKARLLIESKKHLLRGEDEIINGLITARLLKHFTQADMAQKMGCDQAMLSRIENGRSSPSLHTIARMMEILDVGVAILNTDEMY